MIFILLPAGCMDWYNSLRLQCKMEELVNGLPAKAGSEFLEGEKPSQQFWWFFLCLAALYLGLGTARYFGSCCVAPAYLLLEFYKA